MDPSPMNVSNTINTSQLTKEKCHIPHPQPLLFRCSHRLRRVAVEYIITTSKAVKYIVAIDCLPKFRETNDPDTGKSMSLLQLF